MWEDAGMDANVTLESLAEVLQAPLERHRRLSSLWTKALDQLEREGLVIFYPPKGSPRGQKPHPALTSAIRLSGELLRLERVLRQEARHLAARIEDKDDPIARLVDPAIRAASGKPPATESGRRSRARRQNK